MKKNLSILSLFVMAALLVTACSAYSPTTQSSYSPTVAIPVTGGGAQVDLANNAQLGSILVDAKGMTLYLFTKDTPNTPTCYDKCAQAWPPLLTTGAATSGVGVDNALLGTTKRTDGSMQVTYNSWPLYYYATDIKAGDVTGEGVGSVWFAVSAAGKQVMGSAQVPTMAATVMATVMPTMMSYSGTVNVSSNATLGSFLVDSNGMTLYLYTKDSPNTTTCYGTCATNWPPLLVTGSPTAGKGLDATKLGTVTRTDGSMQVTYNGWPLYHFKNDKAAGDTAGQGVGSVWYTIDPAGGMISTY